jgi:O-acetylserine/cysteine efflux transporter
MTTKTVSLPLSHILLAIAVAAMWGSNFVIIKMALTDLPPLLFATLRFCFAFLPAAFFIRRPPVPWRYLAAYGVLIGAGQFGLLFIAMKHNISPGLASLVIQTQVFFTIGLSMWIRRESIHIPQIIALSLAAAGLLIIMAQGGHDATALGLILTLLAAFCWGSANLVARAGGTINMLAYVVWASLFSIPPLIALSLIFEGWPAIQTGLHNASAFTWGAVLYQSVGNTMFGYATWGWLLARHPAAIISPFALLVPIFGMASSAFFLAEPLQPWKLTAAGLVLSGLLLNIAWARLQPLFAR